MVKRNMDGTLFVGEIVEDVKNKPINVIGDDFLNAPIDDPADETADEPKRKGGRPRRG